MHADPIETKVRKLFAADLASGDMSQADVDNAVRESLQDAEFDAASEQAAWNAII